MNILLTGSGFLAKEVIDVFGESNILCVSRKELSNVDSLKDAIVTHNISFIIHTSWASVGEGSQEDFDFNMRINNNMCEVAPMVTKIFIFGSGIEKMPYDERREHYQKAKQRISESCRNHENMINLRLFGCFGKNEEPTRFIAQSITRLKNGLPVKISQNKRMDFFYAKDLISVIRHYMDSSDNLPQDVDCVYPESEYSDLGSIGRFLSLRYGISEPVIFDQLGYNKGYSGDSTTLSSLNIPLKGLIKGIEEIYGK